MRTKRRFATVLLALSLLPGLALAEIASAEMTGTVFLDTDGDGDRDRGELGRAGIVVSNGIETTVTSADGSYRLAEGSDGVAFVVRPANFAVSEWYRAGGGDFALTPDPHPDDFFFIQISDVHSYPKAQDYQDYSQIPLPWWLPRAVGSWIVVSFLKDFYPEKTGDEIVGAFREELMPYRDVSDAWSATVMTEYNEEFLAPGSELGNVDSHIRAAISEVAGLGPSFVISTGDLLLESNNAPRDVVERWFDYYDGLTKATGIPFYDTIGNNELAGIGNDEFDPSDEGYGKGVWKAVKGPTHFSFDRGRFHFVALDTHRPAPKEDEPKWWDFGAMNDEVRGWVAADLERHAGRVLVGLNHEPFHTEPEWGDFKPASDDGLFERFGVAYVLAGHTHRNGLDEQGATTHITTGALSGTRWIVPRKLHQRGYRLFYAKEERLYSAWKPLDAPVLGFVEPRGADEIAPGSKTAADPMALSTAFDVVAVAADAKGPFGEVELTLDDRPIPFERWGSYFLHASLPALTGPATLVLRATDARGGTQTAELAVAPAGR